MKIRKEIWIGLVVLTSIGVGVYGYNFLKGIDLLKSRELYYAVYDKIDGLNADNVIQVNGFTVGKVNKITFHPEMGGKIVVEFIITNQQVKIPKNTLAKIVSLDLLGSKAISLQLGNDTALAAPGDTLISDTQASLSEETRKELLPLKRKTEDLILSIDSVVSVVQAVLDKDARKNLSQSFESIKRAIATFEKTALRMDTLVGSEKRKLENIFTNVESISSNLKDNNENLSNAIKNFSSISDSLAKIDIASTINNANAAIKDITIVMDRINNGEGTVGQLINNDTLYGHLENATENLDILLEDMRVHPKRYVHFSIFGKRDKGVKLSAREERKLKQIIKNYPPKGEGKN